KHSMMRHPMEIKDTGIEILWDKFLKVSGSVVRVEPLSKEEVEAMKRAVEEAEKRPSPVQRKIEVEEE
ncbi:MAG: KaiC domain-containing protein, partial [Pyrobaculum sp.]